MATLYVKGFAVGRLSTLKKARFDALFLPLLPSNGHKCHPNGPFGARTCPTNTKGTVRGPSQGVISAPFVALGGQGAVPREGQWRAKRATIPQRARTRPKQHQKGALPQKTRKQTRAAFHPKKGYSQGYAPVSHRLFNRCRKAL